MRDRTPRPGLLLVLLGSLTVRLRRRAGTAAALLSVLLLARDRATVPA